VCKVCDGGAILLGEGLEVWKNIAAGSSLLLAGRIRSTVPVVVYECGMCEIRCDAIKVLAGLSVQDACTDGI
jgi:hypothetical protein